MFIVIKNCRYQILIICILFFLFKDTFVQYSNLESKEYFAWFYSLEIYHWKFIYGPLTWSEYADNIALINSKVNSPLVIAVKQQYVDISNNYAIYEKLLVPYREVSEVEKISVCIQSDSERFFYGVFYVLYHLIVYNQQFLEYLERVLNS